MAEAGSQSLRARQLRDNVTRDEGIRAPKSHRSCRQSLFSITLEPEFGKTWLILFDVFAHVLALRFPLDLIRCTASRSSLAVYMDGANGMCMDIVWRSGSAELVLTRT